MGVFSTVVGGVSGFCITLMGNAGRKIPLAREPWWHVTFTMIGLYMGNQWPKWERQLMEDINEIRRVKGLPPLVPSDKWLGLEIDHNHDGNTTGSHRFKNM